MSMVTIRYDCVPLFLRDGEFFRSMDRHDLKEIEVPSDCFQEKLMNVKTFTEFRHLLKVTLYWTLDKVPLALYEFFKWEEAEVWQPAIVEINGAEELLFRALRCNLPEGQSRFYMAAVKTGSLRLMKLLHERGVQWQPKELCAVASKLGHLDCLKYAHQNGCTTTDTFNFGNRCVWDYTVYISAAESGHLHCMEYAYQQGLTWHWEVCDAAARNGHVNCLRFATENGCPWSVFVAEIAAESGSLACLQYAHARGQWGRATICEKAARGGHLSCLRFAHENSCPWSGDTVKIATEMGHVECLRYALEQGCICPENTLNSACRNGDVACLRLLHQHGDSWDFMTNGYAAQCVDSACLQYLHENGCPLGSSTVASAATAGSIATLRYAFESGCQYCDFNEVGSLECLKYLVEVQLLQPEDAAFEGILMRGDMDCLVYYFDQGLPYLEATFHEGTSLQFCDEHFPKHDDAFARCVAYALHRGWVPRRSFISYIYKRDLKHCQALLLAEGWLNEDGSLNNRATSDRRRADSYDGEDDNSECSDFTAYSGWESDGSDDPYHKVTYSSWYPYQA